MSKTKEIKKITLKSNKGITMVSLIITIVVMFIISSITVYTSFDRFEINNFNKMKNDIELLSNKVSNYYLKYNSLPIVRNENNEPIEYTYTSLNFEEGKYYILDLAAMEGMLLNYGEEGFNNLNASDDVYIINERTHHIYYVKGIKVNGAIYYTIVDDINDINDTIPPSKPEIKVISGVTNDEGAYITEVEIEIVPGKDGWSGVVSTIYSVLKDGIEIQAETQIEDSYIYKISEVGTYTIKAKSKDVEGNTTEETEISIVSKIIQIGDYVSYDVEYIDVYTDYNFTANNGWRYIGKDNEGNSLIVSTGAPFYFNFTNNPDTKPIWWAEDDNIEKTYGSTYSANGWKYDDGGYPNYYAAYGLRYNFTSIPFAYAQYHWECSTNAGIFKKIGTKTSGSLTSDSLKATGVKVVDIHCLTLEEINKARGEDEDSYTNVTIKDAAQGLFNLQNLENENSDFGYTLSTEFRYYLANAYIYGDEKERLLTCNFNASNMYGDYNEIRTLRPVIVLSSSILLDDTDNDGIYEIKY